MVAKLASPKTSEDDRGRPILKRFCVTEVLFVGARRTHTSYMGHIKPGSGGNGILSAPEILACQRRALRQDFQLGPRDLRMHAESQAAIGACDHILAAGEVCVPHDTVRHNFRMLHYVSCMAHNARN